MSNFEYRASGSTDIGNVKEINQDAVCVKAATFNGEPCLLALVADGMGGLEHGEKASEMIRNSFEDWFRSTLPDILEDKDTFDDHLVDGWQKIINKVNDTLNKEEENCGTTLTMLFLYEGTYYAANIGDSRIYKRELNQKLYQITEDHSWAHLAEMHGLSPSQIETHPDRNKLTRCIGAKATEHPDVDYLAGDFGKGTSFLLCSDGLRHRVKVWEIEQALGDIDRNTKSVAEGLIDLAKHRGEEDNITAVVIRVIKGEKGEEIHASVSKTEALELPTGS